MDSTRRNLAEEYTASAVAFVIYEGRTIAEVARKLTRTVKL